MSVYPEDAVPMTWEVDTPNPEEWDHIDINAGLDTMTPDEFHTCLNKINDILKKLENWRQRLLGPINYLHTRTDLWETGEDLEILEDELTFVECNIKNLNMRKNAVQERI
jgi:hypothetical protein